MPNLSPLQRYTDLTDLSALEEISKTPLRKSFRVNTLKCAVEEFQKWAAEKGWALDSVPWCSEGFFVKQSVSSFEQPQDDTTTSALGKDLLHQLGHTYMQEAASMLPVALLDPKPGETILDMAAAPGSKTTQIAAKMQNTGVIIANDIQEKRLWTLRAALQRSGVINTILTKKRGEWFGKQMTECFDRVLCDAPCSAQGVCRKDPKALKYCNPKRVKSLQNAQIALLESAVHSAKVGGRIVYSTCTLTPEENEEVVMTLLEKFSGKLEVLDPNAECRMQNAKWDFAIEDSLKIQEYLRENHSELCILNYAFLRLWPQVYDTEGFFSAVLTKTDHTRDVLTQEPVAFQEKPMGKKRRRDIEADLTKRYGTSFLSDDEVLFENNDTILLTNEAVSRFNLATQNYALCLPYVKLQKDGRARLAHELVTFRGGMATSGICMVDDAQLSDLLAGKDTHCDSGLKGESIIKWRELSIGLGVAKEGKLKNWLPRRFVKQVEQ
jgi:16S rRNA (cytosine1407-C5)-methyltransferase